MLQQQSIASRRQERVRSMAFELVQSNDAAPFLNEAQTLAQDAQLDFLEIVGPDGNIVSSAQWPARFGYPEPAASEAAQTPFLKREELPTAARCSDCLPCARFAAPSQR